MIVTEKYETLNNGDLLVRTYSDKGTMIERDGVLYGEAIDLLDSKRVYNETDIPIEQIK